MLNSANKLIGIFSVAVPGETRIVRGLGPELVDQFNWFNATWWNIFNANWSEGGGWLISNGNNGNLSRDNFWVLGQKYEIRVQITAVAGLFYGPYDGFVNGLVTGVAGWYVYEYTPSLLPPTPSLYISSALFNGTLRALSIKSVLLNDVDD